MALFAGVAAGALLLSQAAGLWVDANIPRNATLEVSRLVHFTHIRNHGGVFGIAQGMGWLFGLAGAAMLAGVTAWLALSRTARRREYLCFGLVAGGGASNLLDRAVRGGVIDYIDVQHIPYWHYVFNAADVMVHAGVWPLLVLGLAADRKRAP